MIHHHIKIKPSDRLLGNAAIAHILHRQCYGRMMLVKYQEDTELSMYQAIHQCVHCGDTIRSYTSKSGL